MTTTTDTAALFVPEPSWVQGDLPDDAEVRAVLPWIADDAVTHGRIGIRRAMQLGHGLTYRDARTALAVLTAWRVLEPGEQAHRCLIHRDELPRLLNALGGLR